MVMYLFELAKEMQHDFNETGEKPCEHLAIIKPSEKVIKAKIDEQKIIMRELSNPKTGFFYEPVDHKFMFNAQDISQEVGWMASSFINDDFRQLGFLFGNAIDKHAYDMHKWKWLKEQYFDRFRLEFFWF